MEPRTLGRRVRGTTALFMVSLVSRAAPRHPCTYLPQSLGSSPFGGTEGIESHYSRSCSLLPTVESFCTDPFWGGAQGRVGAGGGISHELA